MATDCLMCGKEFNGAGSFRKVADILLFPLCSSCHQQCYENPNNVVTKYPRLFDKSRSTSTSTLTSILVSDPNRQVVVTDVRMPFGSMVVFMVKWAIASIPAFIILAIIGFFAWGIYSCLS